ncbi:MAG: GyrI-like domain-containing protein [Candidatus Hydrogenedentes bacterium]|nr:GyrI-like domain-containing protein [Candidatus Hydrogenedentota bacterium]
MNETSVLSGAPRVETAGPLNIAGLNERYNHTTRVNIPAQWQRFAPYIGAVPGQVDGVAYGVCWSGSASGEFNYLTGVEVAGASNLPAGFECLTIPAQRYAVFTHRGHIAGLPESIQSVWTKALPASGYQAVQSPFIERYDSRFDAQTGMGEVELWVAIHD